MKQKIRSNSLLVLTALIWGSTFVAQSVGMNYIGPFTFNSIRSLMGGVVLLPVIFLFSRRNISSSTKRPEEQIDSLTDKKNLWAGGISCGIALTIASSLQQIGLVYSSAGKAGFLTAVYILIVPMLGIFLGKKIGIQIWSAVAIAIAGIYLLCMKEGFSIAYGDILILSGALVFSIHIMIIDYFAPKVDGIKMSCIQFFVCGFFSGVPMLLWEKPIWGEVISAYIPLLYAGVLSCGVAYTLQIIAQKNTDPTVASLILSMESVFAAVTSWIVIKEKLSMKETIGCVLVFAAIILAQLPKKKKS
jgi:drug/metabolite transporter (DMT)-like permease